METTDEELCAGACTLVDLLASGARDGGGGAAERALLTEGAADRKAGGEAVVACPGVDLDVDVLQSCSLSFVAYPAIPVLPNKQAGTTY